MPIFTVPPGVATNSDAARSPGQGLVSARWMSLRGSTSRPWAAPTGSPWCSPTASAATRTCGASWPPPSRTSSASCSSTTSAPAAPTPRPTTPRGTATLDGYADDVLEILRDLDLHDVVLVGHSVSAMIGALAQVAEPERFDRARDGRARRPATSTTAAYVGGFSEADILELLESLESNYLGWSAAMAPADHGQRRTGPSSGAELTESFCRTDPAVARQFAQVTFLSDNRAVLSPGQLPDARAPVQRRRHRAGRGRRATSATPLPDGTMVVLEATGHCPHLSAPEETIAAIDRLRPCSAGAGHVTARPDEQREGGPAGLPRRARPR